jgi:hypothetical protein
VCVIKRGLVSHRDSVLSKVAYYAARTMQGGGRKNRRSSVR